jgi:hypothetical protein
MNSSALVVTAPDDTVLDGVRILLIDLDGAQTQIVSDCLKNLEYEGRVILYFWNSEHDLDWMLDKKHKSDHIIFNADSTNDLIIGYMSAQANSSYFGTLKLLSKVAGSAIYSIEQCKDLLSRYVGDYEDEKL